MSPETLTFATREGAALEADLYRAAEGGAPLLVGVHGGAWLRGERGQLAHWGRYLAKQGVSLLAIDYRKSGAAPSWPGNLEDVRDAWLFARDNADDLGVDASRIGFLGASAGAHLAALAALTTEARARVLVLAYGVYDLFAHARAEVDGEAPEDNPALKMLGCAPSQDPQRFFAASPMLQVSAERAKGMRALVTWGTADRLVLPAQSEGMVAALGRVDAQVVAAPVEGAGHSWFSRDAIDDPDGFTQALAPRVAGFLQESFLA